MACVCENVDVGVGNITHFPTNSQCSGRLRASLTVGQIWQVGLALQPSSYDVKAVARVGVRSKAVCGLITWRDGSSLEILTKHDFHFIFFLLFQNRIIQ